MRKLLIAASLCAMAGATAAYAQPTPEQRHEHREVQREVAHDRRVENREIAHDRAVVNREINRDRALHNRAVNREINRDRAAAARERYLYRGHPYNRYHGPAYRYPRGFGYRAWGRGQYLPRAYFASPYYIYNWALYALAPPPPGFRYIRVGPDILLVNLRTGFISETIPGVFF